MGRRSSESRPRTTIRDVARVSGFSLTTVSFVLNDAPLAQYISTATKDQIRDVALKLGYHPNIYARFLRTNRSRTIGLMVFDIADPFCTPIIGGVQSVLYPASYLPLFIDVQNNYPRFEKSLEMLLGSRVEGLLVIANWVLMDVNLLADLVNIRMPVVMIARGVEMGSVSCIKVDNEAGGFAAVQCLYAKGHRQIAFIRGPTGLSDSAIRWQGIQQFARTHSLEIDPDLVVDLPETKASLSAFDSSLELTRKLIQKKRPFTAILAFDDISALGAIRALSHANIRVPQECSVIGFDDIAFAELCVPRLTTVRQPLAMMGRMAATLLLEAVREHGKGESEAVLRTVIPELVMRDSVVKPRSGTKGR